MIDTGLGILQIALESVMVVVFATSSIAKVSNFAGFVSNLKLWITLPAGFTTVLGMGIVAGETTVTFLFAFQPHHQLVWGLSLLLLAVFTLTLFMALLRKKAIRCHCFGESQTDISNHDLLRNAILILFSVIGFFITQNQEHPFNDFLFFPSIVVGVLIAVLLIHLKELLNSNLLLPLKPGS